MDSKRKLSVGIITYSQEKYISQTLENIVSQELPQNTQIVIGEDHSNDYTPQICDSFKEKYPEFITVFHNNPNLGAMKNYYNVVKNCDSEYFMECAGDDYWLPNKVSFQLKFMEENPEIDFIYGKVKGIDEKGNVINFMWGNNLETFDDVFNNEASIPPVTFCVRTSVLKEYLDEVKPDSKDWKMEDYPFYLWLFKNKKTKFIDKEFAAYRVLDNSVSHSSQSSEKEINFQKSILDVRMFYINKYQLPESYKKIAEQIFYRNLLGIGINHSDKKLFLENFKYIENKSIKDYLKFILVKLNCFCFFKRYK